MSGLQNIDPPPHHLASVYPPAFGAGGGHTRWLEWGVGVNLKTSDTALYSTYVSTLCCTHWRPVAAQVLGVWWVPGELWEAAGAAV